MKNIKKVILLFMPVLMLLSACEQAPEPGQMPGGETEVEMRFSAPTTYGPTRAVDQEDAIVSMQILVFSGDKDSDTFLYRRTAWQRAENMYRSTLQVADNVTLRFVANAGNILGKAVDLFEAKATWGEIKERLVMADPTTVTVAAGLPMWGEIRDATIKDEKLNTLGTVPMLRSVASLEMKMPADQSEFQLEEAWLVFAADKGYLHYSYEQVSVTGTAVEVLKPNSPASFVNQADILMSSAKGTTDIKNIYMFDNAATLYGPPTQEVKPTKIILKGTWHKDEPGARSTYYPLAFRDSGKSANDQKLQITRNTKYIIQVSKVNGDGYETMAEAKLAEDINIKYEVVPWENNGDQDIYISENYWVSLQTRTANFPRAAGFSFRINFSTNVAYTGMYLWDGSDYQTAASTASSPVIINDSNGKQFASVRLMKKSNDFTGRNYELLFNLLRDYDTPGISNTGTMKVKVGRIEFDMDMIQHDIANGDWEFGGEVVWGR